MSSRIYQRCVRVAPSKARCPFRARESFLRVKQTEGVITGGSDKEILQWWYSTGRRRLNKGVLMVCFAAAFLEQMKQQHRIAHRTGIQILPRLIDLDERRLG